MAKIMNIDPSFSIDYDADTFVMDGQPFRYVSGSLHYFR
jgi:beta-galactosidase